MSLRHLSMIGLLLLANQAWGQTAPAPPTPPPAKSQSQLGASAPGKAAPVVKAPTSTKTQKPPPKTTTKPPVAAAATVGAAAGAAAAAAPTGAPTPAPSSRPPLDLTKGSMTGMPLPRWAALRADEVNMRSGPGQRYPIEWVYHRRDLPVQIQREFEVWRLIEDQDGVKGWVHQATLVGKRGFVVQKPDQTLRGNADDKAAPVAVLRKGVVGRIRACDATASWCEVQVGAYRGWLKRDAIWGISPNEVVTN